MCRPYKRVVSSVHDLYVLCIVGHEFKLYYQIDLSRIKFCFLWMFAYSYTCFTDTINIRQFKNIQIEPNICIACSLLV